jgi:undecaprenyl-diphosphatase
LVAGAGVLVFVGAALLVASGPPAWDAELYRDLNEVPSGAASILTPLSRLCLVGGLTLVVVLAVVYVLVRTRSLLPVAIGAGAAVVAMLAANLAKAVADRPRPYEVVAGAILRQQPAHGTSFPSSHTAAAFATAIALLPFLSRPVGVVAIGYAALVGWSRVYVGVHYPLDVLGGAGIGLAVGGVALVASSLLVRHAGTATVTNTDTSAGDTAPTKRDGYPGDPAPDP